MVSFSKAQYLKKIIKIIFDYETLYQGQGWLTIQNVILANAHYDLKLNTTMCLCKVQ